LQAFLEFEDEGVATTFVNYYSKMPCQIRSKQVYVQFSQHKELKTDQAHSFQVSQETAHFVDGLFSSMFGCYPCRACICHPLQFVH